MRRLETGRQVRIARRTTRAGKAWQKELTTFRRELTTFRRYFEIDDWPIAASGKTPEGIFVVFREP